MRIELDPRLLVLRLGLRFHCLGIGLRRGLDDIALLVLLRLVQIIVRILDAGGGEQHLESVIDLLLVDQVRERRLAYLLHRFQHGRRLADLLLLVADAQAHGDIHVHVRVPSARIDPDPLVPEPDRALPRLMFHEQAQHKTEQLLDPGLGENAGDHLDPAVASRFHRRPLRRRDLAGLLQRVGVDPLPGLRHAGFLLHLLLDIFEHRERLVGDEWNRKRDQGFGSGADRRAGGGIQQIVDRRSVVALGRTRNLNPRAVREIDVVERLAQNDCRNTLIVEHQVREAAPINLVRHRDRAKRGEWPLLHLLIPQDDVVHPQCAA